MAPSPGVAGVSRRRITSRASTSVGHHCRANNRVASDAHNEARSLQNVRELRRLGFDEAHGGREALLDLFVSSRDLPPRMTTVNAYGTRVVRRVLIGEPPIGALDITYFYRGSDMAATPEITTLIPRIFR